MNTTYIAWCNMKARCDNPNNDNYMYYGGRGITYDPTWKHYKNFLRDMGHKPERIDSLSLDRIDNDGPYSKDNCRWATKAEQMSNKRQHKGDTHKSAKLSAAKVVLIKALLRAANPRIAPYYIHTVIGDVFGVNRRSIFSIQSGRNWKDVK